MNMSFHNVESVHTSERLLDSQTCVRHLVFTNNEGQRFELTLFSDSSSPEKLMIQHVNDAVQSARNKALDIRHELRTRTR